MAWHYLPLLLSFRYCRNEVRACHAMGATFYVLLFQDLAAVVLLILIPLISPNSSEGVGFQASAEALGLLAMKACNYCHNYWRALGKIKLNVDGSRKLGGGGGFGGVFRDERGAWVCGYYGKLDSGTSLETEQWALYKGLTVMLQKGMHEVIIETDAKQVVQLMEDATDEKFPYKGLLEDAKIIFRGCECIIHHIYKEGNLCANALAKFGAEQPEDILVVNEPPMEIQCYLVADMIGLSKERA